MARLSKRISRVLTAPSPLTAHLKRRIALEGPLTVADFMAEALGHPEHGYYKKGRPFGVPGHDGGDFITAPEISQIFGELIGLWLVQAWIDCGKPNPFMVLELGPGRGVLMSDILRAAKLAPEFLGAAKIHLVETSPSLRDEQATQLSGYECTWSDTLAEALLREAETPLFFVANEFFDALPIRQCQKTENGWRERLVAWSSAESAEEESFGLVLSAGTPSVLALAKPEDLDAAPIGAVLEIAPSAIGIAGELGAHIAKQGGAGLVIDYGYTQEGAMGDTLQAMKRHRHVPIFETPGDADLTAHVDFFALGAAARQQGARVDVAVDQGPFLLSLGAEARLKSLQQNATAPQAETLRAGLERLTDPKEMGSLFKVMALTSGFDPAGFPLNRP